MDYDGRQTTAGSPLHHQSGHSSLLDAMAMLLDQGALAQLTGVLELANRPDTESQRQVVEQLDYFDKNVPELPAYLAHVFALAREQRELVRVRAGLSLKNTIQQRLAAFPPNVLEYVKEALWAALEDETSSQIRATASSVLDWLIRCIGPMQWPQAIARLVQYMQSPQPATQEAAYKTLANICRQSPRVLGDVALDGQRPIDTMVPLMIQQGLSSPSEALRKASLSALNSFIVPQLPILQQHMQPFLTAVFNLTSDTSIAVRQGVVESLNTLLTFWPEMVIPHIEPVIDFMLYCLSLKEEQEAVALVAAEFLLTFTEEPDLYDQLQIHLERFLPGLLQALAYTPSSREVLDLDAEDYAKPDKESEVKPHIYKSRTTGTSAANAKVPSLAARLGMTADDIAALGNGNADEDEDDYGDEEDEEDEDEEGESDWTVRIAAGTALQTAAEGFEGALLEILLPLVTQMLGSQDWFQREAAVHALGNVAKGCSHAMYEHLVTLVPFLLQSLADANPLIRSGAAWTIGEYSAWVADEGKEHLMPVMQNLLGVALDNNKHAQGIGIIAFGQLAKEAGPTGLLAPYLQAIAQAFVAAFSKYQSKNTLKLYEALEKLSDGIGAGGLNDEQALGTLMPPLIQRWQAFGDDDPNLLHLLGCLTSLVVAAGPGFKAYADPVFERAHRLIHSALYQYQVYQSDPTNNEKPETGFLVVALDLVSGLMQGLGKEARQNMAPFVQPSQDGSLPILLVCISYPEADVRQSAFALIGDIANRDVEILYPVLQQLLPMLVEAINPSPKIYQVSAESNCAWCTGELASALGGNIEPFVDTLIDRLTPVLSSLKANPGLLENAAVCLGRIALACPQKAAPRLSDFVRPWSQTMMHVSASKEQDLAMRGICEAARYNPQAMQDAGQFFLQALAKSDNPSNELREVSAPIIQTLQQ